MMFDYNKDLIYFVKRDGTTENPYHNINENINVLYEKAFLEEVPVESFRVVAKVGNTILTEVYRPEDVKTTNQYYVNYKQGIVHFHNSKNSVLVTLDYRGQGVLLYPASRIYIDSETGVKDSVKTLRDLIKHGAEAIEAITSVQDVIDRADNVISTIETAVINSNNAVELVKSKITEIDTAEANRLLKENERQSNEQTRISNETERKNSEQTRIASENVRISSEIKRASDEALRVTNENTRLSNETKRESKELTRQQTEFSREVAETNRELSENTRMTVETKREESESARKSNEDIRINAETKREESENTRKSNEDIRIASESTRKDMEDSRIANEIVRKSNEDTRVTNESARKSSETTRVSEEEVRKSNELLRIASENQRVSSELTRESKEAVRTSNENSRLSSEITRVSNEELRVSAESARASEELLRKSQEAQREERFQTISNELNTAKINSEKATSDAITSTEEASRVIAEATAMVDNTTFKDEFNIEYLYDRNNIVSYNGSSYIAKQPTIGHLPTNEVYWGRLALKGLDGKGSVSTINNLTPDLNGNINITLESMGAEGVDKKGVADGYASLDSNAKVPLSQIPDVLKQQTFVVVGKTERESLTNLISGDKAYETSTGDSYIYDGSKWQILADADWENVSLEWINIVNKPNSTVESIDLSVLNSHTHNNKDILDKFSIVGGKLRYDGTNIGNVDSVNGMTGVVTITSASVGAYSKGEIDSIVANINTNVNNRILNSEKGVANGVARLNASGKVVDANGNEVEGKVLSVNGQVGAITGLETVAGANSKIANHEKNEALKHVEIFNARPTELDKIGILFIKKNLELESPQSNTVADLNRRIDELLSMINSIELEDSQFKGLEENLPTLEDGRFGFTTDTKKIFIGSKDGNIQISTKEIVDAIQIDLDNLGVDVGDLRTQIQTMLNHIADKNNPHGVTKTQLGLGNLQDYGIATQVEAEAGTSSTKYMTPQRTSQAIAKLATPIANTAESNAKTYTDNRLANFSLKVEAYKHVLIAQFDKQKGFDISNVFNQTTDTLIDVAQNGWVLSGDRYTIADNNLYLTESVNKDTVISFTILKNIPLKEQQSQLIAGDMMAGYYGKVNGLVTGDDLFTKTGLITGTKIVSTDITWLKFSHNYKTLLVADRPLKTQVSWSDIQAQDLVKGKAVEIDGKHYLCRLMTGGNSNPATGTGGEWDDLIVRFTPSNTDSYWSTGDMFTICQEIYHSNLDYRVARGMSAVTRFDFIASADKHSYRPVLELL